MPLCLTFIDLKKPFDSVETEAVVEALDNQGVPTQYIKVDGPQLHHLRFPDDIIRITPSISQAERMLTEFDETCGCFGLQLNLDKTMFMRNGWVSNADSALQEDRRPDGQISSRCPSKKNMMLTVSHAKEGTTGLLWHAIGTNGRIIGARSTSSKINGSQDAA
ncbi:hypothetical protein RB195_023322 [Necator americanus]|uniref:Reverse transcriptase domain-containing protein n=1 Tax=Necator americanus TaxID=51031 RepID=A0ABR1EIQ4_NECAM